MLILRTSPTSPFGRKARLAAEVLGFQDLPGTPDRHLLSVSFHSNTVEADDSLRIQNPLGKVPVLLTETEGPIYDSRVILEYLDWRAGSSKILPAAPEKFRCLRLQALADGIMDAGILRIYETRFRGPEKREQRWLDHQAGKMARALDALGAEPPPQVVGLPDVGAIALACALGFLDYRYPGWRPDHSRLAAWVDDFSAAVPGFGRTTPPPRP